jgi:hypothetical protein
VHGPEGEEDAVGKVEAAVRAFIKEKGQLIGPEEALGELALKVAQAIDDPNTETRQLPNLSKELRLALEQFEGGATGGDDDGWGDLPSPE